MLPGYVYNVPIKDCFVIGLLLNRRGMAELHRAQYMEGTQGKLIFHTCKFRACVTFFSYKIGKTLHKFC